MKSKVLALLIPALLAAGAAHAAEVYNKDGNKLDLYGKVDGLHYFSDNSAKDGDQSYARLGFKGETQINDQLTGYGQWEYNIQANNTESSKNQSWTRLAFAGLKFADYGSFDYGRNYGVMYDNEGASNGQEGTNNGRDVRHENGDGWGLSTTYDLGMGFSAGAAYTSSDRTNDQVNHTAAGGDKADAWTAGLKYDANNIYLATMYSETRNMTPFGDSDYAVANKTQNFEVTAQYQFDFGLRPAVSFLMSKGRDLHAAGGADNPAGVDDKDLVKYADVGATYYFNKNMSTYVDYKINLLDEDDSFYAANGISTDDIVALGLVYQF